MLALRFLAREKNGKPVARVLGSGRRLRSVDGCRLAAVPVAAQGELRVLGADEAARSLAYVQVHGQVEAADAYERHEELDARRGRQVDQVVVEGHLALVVLDGLHARDELPEDDGRPVVQERDDPHREYENDGLVDLLAGDVVEAPAHQEVAVQTYDDYAQDAGAAHHVVEHEPHGARERPESPVALVEQEGRVRGYEHADEQVRHGQVEYEVVGVLAQVLVDDERRDDEHVADDGHGGHESGDRGDHDREPRRIGQVGLVEQVVLVVRTCRRDVMRWLQVVALRRVEEVERQRRAPVQ